MNELSSRFVVILSVACGVTVANLYYNQPLLVDIGSALHASSRQMGLVATLTQVGYALGMLAFVPLGDMLERRRLILGLLLAVTAALVGAALAPNWRWLAGASLAIGLTTVVPQILIPYGAYLAEPHNRGKVIGSLYTGLLLGILLARTLSGFVGEHWGWRAMFWLAAGMSLVMVVVLAAVLRPAPPVSDLPYRKLLASLWTLAHTQPTLREAAWIGATLFGAFSAFWTTLAFRLATPPYHYGPQVAGLFGVIGASGAAAAPLAGRLADRWGSRFVIGWAVGITLGAFAIFWLFGVQLWGLVLGVIALDVGVQMAQVSNQTRILGLVPEAQGRINTVYMIAYFCGGSLGSLVGAWCWSQWQWAGVCGTGAALAGLACVVYLKGAANKTRETLKASPAVPDASL